MFRHPVDVLLETIKSLETSLKINQKTNHLNKDNVEEMQKTISYLSAKIVDHYENLKANH